MAYKTNAMMADNGGGGNTTKRTVKPVTTTTSRTEKTVTNKGSNTSAKAATVAPAATTNNNTASSTAFTGGGRGGNQPTNTTTSASDTLKSKIANAASNYLKAEKENATGQSYQKAAYNTGGGVKAISDAAESLWNQLTSKGSTPAVGNQTKAVTDANAAFRAADSAQDKARAQAAATVSFLNQTPYSAKNQFLAAAARDQLNAQLEGGGAQSSNPPTSNTTGRATGPLAPDMTGRPSSSLDNQTPKPQQQGGNQTGGSSSGGSSSGGNGAGGNINGTGGYYVPQTTMPATPTIEVLGTQTGNIREFDGIQYDVNRDYWSEILSLLDEANYYDNIDPDRAGYLRYQAAQLEEQRNAKIRGEGLTDRYSITTDLEELFGEIPQAQPTGGTWTSELTGDTYEYGSMEEFMQQVNEDAYRAYQMRMDEYEQKYLEQQELARQFAYDQAVNELNNSYADASANYRDMMAEADYRKAQNDDNLTLRLSQAGDLGGLGQKQYSDAQSSFDQQMFELQLERQNAKNEIDREAARLRAQGEFDKANAVIEFGMQRLQQLDEAAVNYANNMMNIANDAYERRLAEDEINYNRAMDRLQMGMFRPEDAIALGVDPSQAQTYANRLNVLANLDLEAALIEAEQLRNPVTTSRGGGSSSSSNSGLTEQQKVFEDLAAQGYGLDNLEYAVDYLMAVYKYTEARAKAMVNLYEQSLSPSSSNEGTLAPELKVDLMDKRKNFNPNNWLVV